MTNNKQEMIHPVLVDCAVKFHHPDAKMPTWATTAAMGCDLYCVGGCEGIDTQKQLGTDEQWAVTTQGWEKLQQFGKITLYPGDAFLFRTGLSIAIPSQFGCLLWDRSGMGGIKNVHRLAGVIDADYRGEWYVSLINLSKHEHVIKVGDKIVQGVFQQRVRARFTKVNELPPSDRGDAGFGSTGA